MNSKIFLTGFMGSGKTFWGKIWTRRNDLKFYDLDEEIEKIAGQSVAEIFKDHGEDHFRIIERDVLRTFAGNNNFVLACGGGTPCFFENLAWMNNQGLTIYLRASADEIFNRINNETGERPLLNKVDQSELLLFIKQKLKEREPIYQQAKHILQVGLLTEDSLGGVLKGEL